MQAIISFFLVISTFILNLFGATATINVSKEKLQTISGFGTSSAWWARMIEDDSTRDEIAKAVFSKEGLGLNIYRYNVGGGVNPEKNRIGEISRRTESFLYYNEETKSFEYDFNRDKNSRLMLEKALSYGCVDTVVLFANSPHYSMTKNGETAGSETDTCNLAPEHYRDFVDYMLTITEHFLEKGIPVKFISPINEPQWSWGGDWVGREGCHYTPEEFTKLFRLFAKSMKEREIPVKLMVPESGEIGKTTRNWIDKLVSDKEISDVVGSYAYHSYFKDGNVADKMNHGSWRRQKHKKLSMDMTEWCELPSKHDINDFESAVLMARVIADDFRFEQTNSWSNWVTVNTPSWGDLNYSDGLFSFAINDYNTVTKAARYYALAHFSKFVPEGSVMLKTSINKNNRVTDEEGYYHYQTSFSAFKTPNGETVVVLVNEGKTRDFKINIPKASNMRVISSDGENFLNETYNGTYKSKLNVKANSITTIIYS